LDRGAGSHALRQACDRLQERQRCPAEGQKSLWKHAKGDPALRRKASTAQYDLHVVYPVSGLAGITTVVTNAAVVAAGSTNCSDLVWGTWGVQVLRIVLL
jgi:hypothetical protein